MTDKERLADHAMREVQRLGQEIEQEHITDGGKCWCDPELDYKDPNTGVEVWIHKDLQ
jgi:hypothetical protein